MTGGSGSGPIRRAGQRRTPHVAATSSFSGVDDVALVIAIARYNEEAFAEAYSRHGGAVFALSMRLHRASPLTTHGPPFSVRKHRSLNAAAVWLQPKKDAVLKGLAARHCLDLLRERGQRRLNIRDTPGPIIVRVGLRRHRCTA